MGKPGGVKERQVTLIGLTGNIATGKSEVARMLAGLGARVRREDETLVT